MATEVRNHLITVATSTAEFCGMETSWRELYASCAHPTPFSSWEWAIEWWKHFGAHFAGPDCNKRLHIVQIRDTSGRLICIAPFYRAPATVPLGARRLVPLGVRSRLSDQDLTDEPVLLLRKEQETEGIRAIYTHVCRSDHSRKWDQFLVGHVRPADPEQSAYEGRIRSDGPLPRIRRHTQNPIQILSLPGQYDTFFRALGEALRRKLRQYERNLARDGHTWELSFARTPDEVEAAVPILVDLHGRRAKSQRGPVHRSYLDTDLSFAFVRACLRRLSEAGMAFAVILYIDHEPAGIVSVLETRGTQTLYYTGFDPKWYDYSPITILIGETIKDGIDRGATQMSFGPYVEDWKSRWGAKSLAFVDETYGVCPRIPAILRAGVSMVGGKLLKP